MVKRILPVMLFLFLAARVASAAVEIKDVEKGSWAYDVIVKLIDKGYLSLYDDKTFRPDQPVTRVVLAAALGRLMDQIESGALKVSAGDMKDIKKLGDTFRSEMADVDAKLSALDKRISDIESGKVVIQQDLSKTTYDFGKKTDVLEAENQKLKENVNIMTDDLKTLSIRLDKSEKARKSMQTMMFVGLVIAIAVGAASN